MVLTISGWQCPRLSTPIPAPKPRRTRVIGSRLLVGRKYRASSSAQFSLALTLVSSYYGAGPAVPHCGQQRVLLTSIEDDAARAGLRPTQAGLPLGDQPALDHARFPPPPPLRPARYVAGAGPFADQGAAAGHDDRPRTLALQRHDVRERRVVAPQ